MKSLTEGKLNVTVGWNVPLNHVNLPMVTDVRGVLIASPIEWAPASDGKEQWTSSFDSVNTRA